MNELTLKDQTTEFLLYTAPSGEVKVEVLLNNETLWLTQERMAELFGVQRPAISKHLKNIFESGELIEAEVVSILEHTTALGAVFNTITTKKFETAPLTKASVTTNVSFEKAVKTFINQTQSNLCELKPLTGIRNGLLPKLSSRNIKRI